MSQSESKSQSRTGRRRTRRDLGRLGARFLCVFFGLIGLIPLGGGFFLRFTPLESWAARASSRILWEELGLTASFESHLSLLPLGLSLEHLVVPGNDGKGPVLVARRASVRPSFFSLISGKLDAGDVELIDAEARLVIAEGRLKNLDYRLPKPKADSTSKPLERSPLRSLAVTNLRTSLEIESLRVTTEDIDLDVYSEPDLHFDLALRIGGATIHRQREGKTGRKIETDRLCSLDLKARVSPDQVQIHRWLTVGDLDGDPGDRSTAACQAGSKGEVRLRLAQFQVKRGAAAEPPTYGGKISSRLPLDLPSRFVNFPEATGAVTFAGEVSSLGGTRLPNVSGVLSGQDLSLDGYEVARALDGQVILRGDRVSVPELRAEWGNGVARVFDFELDPFAKGIPLKVRHIESRGIDFPGIMRAVKVTPNTIVDWRYDHVDILGTVGGISPFFLDGAVKAKTSRFAVYDRAYHDPARRAMIAIREATVDSRWRADARALEFYEVDTRFGKSHLPSEIVSIGLGGSTSPLTIRLKKGAALELADVSPIAGVALEGRSELSVSVHGPMGNPEIDGHLGVKGLRIGGYSVGDLQSAEVAFRPLAVEFKNVKGNHDDMRFVLPSAELKFDGDAPFEFSAAAVSDSFDVREFFEIFHFDRDPRFSDLKGRGSTESRVRYVLGGPEDKCQSGRLWVDGVLSLEKAELFDEVYSGGQARFAFEWFDMAAGSRGLTLNVPEIALRKGSGTLLGRAKVNPGGGLEARFFGTQIPISKISALEPWLAPLEGFVTLEGEAKGTLERPEAQVRVRISELRSQDVVLPGSDLDVRLTPRADPPPNLAERTRCGALAPTEFSEAEYEKDEQNGAFVASGDLFGGQIRLEELRMTRQRKAHFAGSVRFEDLHLAKVLSVTTLPLLKGRVPDATLKGRLELDDFLLSRPFDSNLSLSLSRISLKERGFELELEKPTLLSVSKDGMIASPLEFTLTSPQKKRAKLAAGFRMGRDLTLAASVELSKTEVAIFQPLAPALGQMEGDLSAQLNWTGPMKNPVLSGFVELARGGATLEKLRSKVSDVAVRVDLDSSSINITRGSAKMGGGELSLSGSIPLLGGKLGPTRATLQVRSVNFEPQPEVRVQGSARFDLMVPAPGDDEAELPRVSGDIQIEHASYERPMGVTADLASLGQKSASESTTYQPEQDRLAIDLTVTAKRPLTVRNNLVEGALLIDPAGVRIVGTNQRFGALGTVAVVSGGRVNLRQNSFEIKHGVLRFSDPSQVRPEVDVSASTELRRVEDRGAAQATLASSGSQSTGSSGAWRILMRAFGPPDDLKIELTSDPPLGQDDIFLLLTLGLTRAELEQSRSQGVGGSVAIEALGSLSGAESAVTETVPIDEFRFGSTYSARTGRTEPTVTIGKRLSDRLRASVTSSMSDASEVRSNLEYRATGQVSLIGSYDNAQRAGAPAIGNLGGDVRFRLEFE